MNYGYIPVIFVWGSLTSWMRAIRWKILLATEKNIPTKNVFFANMAGYLGNNILPARAGELIRAIYIGRENGISTSFALATGVIERLVDFITLVFLGTVMLSNTGVISTTFQSGLRGMSAIALIGFVGILTAPYTGQNS